MAEQWAPELASSHRQTTLQLDTEWLSENNPKRSRTVLPQPKTENKTSQGQWGRDTVWLDSISLVRRPPNSRDVTDTGVLYGEHWASPALGSCTRDGGPVTSGSAGQGANLGEQKGSALQGSAHSRTGLETQHRSNSLKSAWAVSEGGLLTNLSVCNESAGLFMEVSLGTKGLTDDTFLPSSCLADHTLVGASSDPLRPPCEHCFCNPTAPPWDHLTPTVHLAGTPARWHPRHHTWWTTVAGTGGPSKAAPAPPYPVNSLRQDQHPIRVPPTCHTQHGTSGQAPLESSSCLGWGGTHPPVHLQQSLPSHNGQHVKPTQGASLECLVLTAWDTVLLGPKGCLLHKAAPSS